MMRFINNSILPRVRATRAGVARYAKTYLRSVRLRALHHEQNGAVLLMALFGLLISLMFAMVMFDTIRGSQAKARVQMGADSAAFSHAAVRARSMNLIAYGNISKRLFFSYNTLYYGAYHAFDTQLRAYHDRCFQIHPDEPPPPPTPISYAYNNEGEPAFRDFNCDGYKIGVVQAISETLDLFYQKGHLLLTTVDEVEDIDRYQSYLADITPWWAWAEAAERGGISGASVAVTWPPPPTYEFPASTGSGGGFGLGTILWPSTSLTGGSPIATGPIIFLPGSGGSSTTGSYYQPPQLVRPSEATSFWLFSSSRIDSLPVRRRDTVSAMRPSGANGTAWAHEQFCNYVDEFFNYDLEETSILFEEHRLATETRPNTISGDANTLSRIVPRCGEASGLLGNAVLDFVLDMNRFTPYDNTPSWMHALSSTSIAYRQTESTSVDREKFRIIRRDYGADEFRDFGLLRGINGMWAVSRAELRFNGGYASMWAPRWSARLRPVALEGEWGPFGHGRGLNGVFHDVMPYLLLADTTGLGEFSFSERLEDLQYFDFVTVGMRYKLTGLGK